MAKQSALSREEDLDRVFHALADPSRRRMVIRLVAGPATVSELAQPLTMAMPTVLQHLKVLEESGLVVSEKQGRVRTCRIEPEPMDKVQGWLAEQRAIWEARFDRLDAYLAEVQAAEAKQVPAKKTATGKKTNGKTAQRKRRR